jgi:hypothetical protein
VPFLALQSLWRAGCRHPALFAVHDERNLRSGSGVPRSSCTQSYGSPEARMRGRRFRLSCSCTLVGLAVVVCASCADDKPVSTEPVGSIGVSPSTTVENEDALVPLLVPEGESSVSVTLAATAEATPTPGIPDPATETALAVVSDDIISLPTRGTDEPTLASLIRGPLVEEQGCLWVMQAGCVTRGF